MPTKSIFCGACRERYKRDPALWAHGEAYFRQVDATSRDHLGRVACVCLRCHYRWASKSPEAARLLALAMATKPEPAAPARRRPVRPIETAGQLSLL